MTTHKIGFACKWMEPDGKQLLEHNTRSTTATKLRNMEAELRGDYLHSLVMHNTEATRFHLETLSKLPECLRMFRMSSDMLPLYTNEFAAPYYSSTQFKDLAARRFSQLGNLARAQGIRLSFHPGQFTTLVSVSDGQPNVRGINEFEYHARVAEFMGYTEWHQDGFAINVHIGGKEVDAKVMLRAIRSLSDTARNLITIENDEFSWGTLRVLNAVASVCPVVLDVHHHWIHTGKHIALDDPLIESIVRSWQGVRPKLHLAMSRRELFGKPNMATLPRLQHLVNAGHTRSDLRSHSDEMWHPATLDYVKPFAQTFDIMVECKTKNQGQLQVAKHFNFI